MRQFCSLALSYSTHVTDEDDCDASPCLNGGTCEDQVAGYICLCADGYEGDNCDDNTDDCAGTPCLNGGTCNDDVNRYECTCESGYTGPSCEIGMFSALQRHVPEVTQVPRFFLYPYYSAAYLLVLIV